MVWKNLGKMFGLSEEEPVIKNIIEKARREGATELNLSGQNLTKVPLEIAQLTHLTALYLYNNQLCTLLPQNLCFSGPAIA